MRMNAKDLETTKISDLPHKVVADGLGFAEIPRWHAGRLWFSDMAKSNVYRIADDGSKEIVCAVPGGAGGLGWLPDGRMLVVSMENRIVYGFDGKKLGVYADLSGLVPSDLNDMVVGPDGTAYVSGFGYKPATEPIRPTALVHIPLGGTPRLQPGELLRPNACVITPDRSKLYVTETRVGRVMMHPILADGSLGAPQLFASLLEGSWSDGLSLDTSGGFWIADPQLACLYYVDATGTLLRRIDMEGQRPLGLAIGGPDRRTLFITNGPLGMPFKNAAAAEVSNVVAMDLAVPGTGWP